MAAAGTSREQGFSLSGFSGRITQGTCVVVSFDQPARRRRAWRALGKAWGAAAICVFIPVAHLLLVPALALFGVQQFFEKAKTAELARDARGTCPDCGAEQKLELGRLRRVPLQVTCGTCQRGLTVTLAA
jgi:hypothetical protein